jgi:hypothetical protein
MYERKQILVIFQKSFLQLNSQYNVCFENQKEQAYCMLMVQSNDVSHILIVMYLMVLLIYRLRRTSKSTRFDKKYLIFGEKDEEGEERRANLTKGMYMRIKNQLLCVAKAEKKNNHICNNTSADVKSPSRASLKLRLIMPKRCRSSPYSFGEIGTYPLREPRFTPIFWWCLFVTSNNAQEVSLLSFLVFFSKNQVFFIKSCGFTGSSQSVN